MMNLTTIVGYAAGTLTTIAFVPQLLKVWRTKSTEDISLLMFLIFTSGVVMWLIYGVLLDEAPIVVTNTVTLGLASAILWLKIKYG